MSPLSRFLPLLAVAVLLAPLTACTERADGADGAAEDREVAAALPAIVDPQRAPLAVADSARARVVVGGIDLTEVGYDRGDPTAPIQVVEFSDFGCGFCAQFARETAPVLIEEFVAPGHVYWKYVPFVIGMFPNGSEAARAGECAAAQGHFWAAKDSLYAGQSRWKRTNDAAAVLTDIAGSAGVDGPTFGRCFAADALRARTAGANDAASRLGVRATPTFFINGQMVEGALPLTVFRGGLRQMLAERGVVLSPR